MKKFLQYLRKSQSYLVVLPFGDCSSPTLGNRILSKMGLNVLGSTVPKEYYEAPDPNEAFIDQYHFQHMVSRFSRHLLSGEPLTAKEEGFLARLRRDCASYLLMEANESASYTQVVSDLTAIVKKAGIPQVKACISKEEGKGDKENLQVSFLPGPEQHCETKEEPGTTDTFNSL